MQVFPCHTLASTELWVLALNFHDLRLLVYVRLALGMELLSRVGSKNLKCTISRKAQVKENSLFWD